ncbi:MAG: conjugal transfer protein TraH [Steroidobacteraceae bacterium]|jgi:bacterioferritin-associated ferredoxin
MFARRTRTLSALAALAAGFFLFASPSAWAGGIVGALSNLLSGTDVSANGPGYFSSEARGVYLMGGAQVRFPTRTSPALISVNPPYVYAGCGGISAYFGGFSYISGQQIKQLIQEIAQNSVGLVSMLAIKELCPQCADVIAEMQAIAQKAADLSINSCGMSKWLIQKGAGLFGKTTNFSDDEQSTLAATAASMGKTSGYLADMYNGVSKVDSVLSSINNDLSQQEKSAGVSPNTTTGQQVLCSGGGECNTVWTLLGDSDLGNSTNPEVIWDKTFLMNLMGTEVRCVTGNTCPNIPSTGFEIYPATLGFSGPHGKANLYNVYRLFLCGVNWQTAGQPSAVVQNVVTAYCSGPKKAQYATAGFTEIRVWQCGDSDLWSNPNAPCLDLVQEPLIDSILGNGAAGQGATEGYLPYVAKILNRGVQEVIANQPLDKQVIALLQLVPAPLYQAINAAAVFPSASQEMVMSMSVYTADLLVDDELRHIARVAGRMHSSSEIPQLQIEQLYKFLGAMIMEARQNNKSFFTSIDMQKALMQQIREINAAVARETVSQGLLGASQFGLAVTRQK